MGNNGYIPEERIVKVVTVNEMADEDKPREKAIRLGMGSLSNAELMAILFRTGSHGFDVMSLSTMILDDFQGHLSHVAKLSVEELKRRYKGLGEAKATTLLAALEIGARARNDALEESTKRIMSSHDAYSRMAPHFTNLDHEEFWVLMLNNANHVIREYQVGKGGVSATVVDVKLIMREALSCLASSMILFHNHPSGTMKPSPQDDSLTRKIADAARLLDIRVNDHIIINTDFGFYSYHDEGKI